MLHTLRRLAGGILTAAIVGLAALMLLPALLGLQRYVILTGSMTGTYDAGSIVYDKVVPVDQLRVGDVITYAPPPGKSPQPLVTHRIFSIKRLADGRLQYRTKGDANRAPDPWRFELPRTAQPRVVFSVPYAGRLVMALADREVRRLVIGLPALIVALLTLAGVARDVRSRRPQPVTPTA